MSDVVIDAGTQQREKINDEIVSEYAEHIQCGNKFPAITVFFDGVQYYLVDGFHRYHAHRISEIKEIEADIHEGTRREAILFSAGVNGAHGLRPSNADKRKSAILLLSDEEWSQWSDHKIAKHCKVTQPFVSKLRKELITVINAEDKLLNNNESEKKLSTGKNEEFVKKDVEKFNPDDHAILELSDTVIALEEENQKLRDSIATNQLPGDVEIKSAGETIEELRSRIKALEAEIDAVKVSRDTYMRDNIQLKKQCKSQFEQLKKAGLIK